LASASARKKFQDYYSSTTQKASSLSADLFETEIYREINKVGK
jgi:hypothetical protein